LDADIRQMELHEAVHGREQGWIIVDDDNAWM
jgi:hypothetical protein